MYVHVQVIGHLFRFKHTYIHECHSHTETERESRGARDKESAELEIYHTQ